MSNVKVSVITFVFVSKDNGRLELLKECIESIRSQGYPSYEHLIVDDGSEVDLTQLVEGYPNTRLIKKAGSGILSSTTTFNLGHLEAKGEYCIYLPSDDLHSKDALRSLADTLDQNPNAYWAIGNAVYEYEEGRISKWFPNKENITTKLGDANYVNGCAVMWRRHDKVYAMLPPNYTGFCSDYDLWCSLQILGDPVIVDADIVRYRLADDSTRHKTRKRLITSPRRPDGYCYQYSKAARIEMVRDRFNYHHIINEQKFGDIVNFDLEVGSYSPALVELIKKRDWVRAHKVLLSESKEYSTMINNIKLSQDKLLLHLKVTLTLAGIVAMHYFKSKAKFDVVCNETNQHDWIYEYLPMPFISRIERDDGTVNEKLMQFLGK